MAETSAGPPRSASTPSLPPLTEGGGRPAHVRGRRAQGTQEQRRQFMEGLLNEDLQKLTAWHGTRPHHEQKRFLRSLDTLYKAFAAPEKAHKPRMTQAQAAQLAADQAAQEQAAAIAYHAAAENDPLNGPPRSPREIMMASASAPNLSNPIQVFEQKKRAALHGPGIEDDNTLNRWIETQSVSTATTGTTTASKMTSFSQLTETSFGTSCSEPGTTNQMSYKMHKRAFAINRNKWEANDQHAAGYLKDGIPNLGIPDGERMCTNYKDTYGSANIGEHVTPQMYNSVFRNEAHPFIERYLGQSSAGQTAKLAGMVRSLEYLRTASKKEAQSLQRTELDLGENQRLWKPHHAEPILGPEQCNLSQVPLGTIPAPKSNKVIPKTPLRPLQGPHSPSVSGLGSLPLSRMSTPQQMATPLVGGRDLPMACAPAQVLNLETVRELN